MILLILEAVILPVIVYCEVYVLISYVPDGGVFDLFWLFVYLCMFIIAVISSNVLAIMGIVATVLTSKLNRVYYNPINIETCLEAKKYSYVPGILGIILPIATCLMYYISLHFI